MTHLRTSIFVTLVVFLMAGVHVTEKFCEDRTGPNVANTPVWKPVTGPVNKLACKKGAEMFFVKSVDKLTESLTPGRIKPNV
jgi:hypothetical protein